MSFLPGKNLFHEFEHSVALQQACCCNEHCEENSLINEDAYLPDHHHNHHSQSSGTNCTLCNFSIHGGTTSSSEITVPITIWEFISDSKALEPNGHPLDGFTLKALRPPLA